MTDCAHENAVSGLPHGVLEGDIPFNGNLVEDGAVRKIGGGIQWRAHLPDSNPEEGKLNVVVVLFVDWDDAVGRVGKRPRGRLRLDGEFVSRLNVGDADAEETVMGMLLENSGAAERFDIQRAA